MTATEAQKSFRELLAKLAARGVFDKFREGQAKP